MSAPRRWACSDAYSTCVLKASMADRSFLPPSAHRWAVRLTLLVVCGWLGNVTHASEQRITPVVKAVQRVRAAVVNIRGEKTVAAEGAQYGQADASRRVNGMGTGVVIDSRGYIVTNHHVVEGVREIQVTLENGDRFTARLVERDRETDLAILKIDAPKPLATIPLGTSEDLMPGESVIAVGNAYGYEHTVTRGIISALHRAVQVSDAQYYEDLIQTDASINPGNSGGPLLNIDGDMIGINVAVRAGAQGIGFAIPVKKVEKVTTELLASCNLKHGWHGLVVDTKQDAEQTTAVVTAIEPNSPAAGAGLKVGDVVTSADEQSVCRALDFQRALLDHNSGDELKLAVRRAGEPLALRLTLTQPTVLAASSHSPTSNRGLAGGRSTSASSSAGGTTWDVLGLELQPIPQEEFKHRFQTRYRGGLEVVQVRSDSPAAVQGIEAGDVLVGMHLWETLSLENVTYIINRADFASFNPLQFYILRGNKALYGYMSLNAKGTPLQR